MFADVTNLLYSHQNIEILYGMVNCALQICEWFRVNKSFLEVTKTYFTIFHEKPTKDDITLKIPELKISNSIIKKKKIS